MTLMTPNVQEMNEMMQKLNVSLFWTGYTRKNQTHFQETFSDRFASCDSNEWTSLTEREQLLKTQGIVTIPSSLLGRKASIKF